MPHFPPNAYFCTMQPSEELKNHIETEIIPRYESFDAAHGTDHVRTVIAQSLDLARHYDVDADMIYAVAAYHDTGLARGRELHHIHSGEILLADTELRRWFTAVRCSTVCPTAPHSTARDTSNAVLHTCGKSTPKAVTSGSGFPNRTTPANRRSCGR